MAPKAPAKNTSARKASRAKLAKDFLKRHPETAVVDMIYADLCGIVRGKRYPASMLEKLMVEGVSTPGGVFLLDVTGENHDPEGYGFSDGDPDVQLHMIPATLVPMPWASKPAAQVMASFVQDDGTAYPFEPRNVLAALCRRLADLALTPVIAFELEFFLIDRERNPDQSPQPPLLAGANQRLAGNQVYSMAEVESLGDLFADIADACAKQGIATGAITAEYAPGQFEINLDHQADALMAADHCVMFKRIVQGVAQKHGLEATFMAKPYPDQSGSGLHMHCSLLDRDGRNLFDEAHFGQSGDGIAPSLRHALGGILDLWPASMAFLAPNINAYRRFAPNNFVPITRSWGLENRSVALRIPRGDSASRRIEHRLAGADANPYLALASLLAGLHYGLTHESDPGPAWTGNAGESPDPALPFRAQRALDATAESTAIAQYFGDTFIKTYLACKRAEFDKFDAIISSSEYAWYMTPG